MATIDNRVLELAYALGSSNDLREVTALVHVELSEFIPADVTAICVSNNDGPGYSWFVSDGPTRFFEEYRQIASEDFVAEAVQAKPGRALRDNDMAERKTIESSALYRFCHNFDFDVEHALSMLVPDNHGHSGITLYRTRRKSFSAADTQTLELLAGLLRQAVSRCRRFAEERMRRELVEVCLDRLGTYVILFDAKLREHARSAGLERWLERWFSATERSRGLPDKLTSWLEEARSWPVTTSRNHFFCRTTKHVDLEVHIERIIAGRDMYFALVFTERSSSDVLFPSGLAVRLTPRQNEVVGRVLAGWDNRLIASELGCAEATVKKHLTTIYKKLGIESRSALHVLVRAKLDTLPA